MGSYPKPGKSPLATPALAGIAEADFKVIPTRDAEVDGLGSAAIPVVVVEDFLAVDVEDNVVINVLRKADDPVVIVDLAGVDVGNAVPPGRFGGGFGVGGESGSTGSLAGLGSMLFSPGNLPTMRPGL